MVLKTFFGRSKKTHFNSSIKLFFSSAVVAQPGSTRLKTAVRVQICPRHFIISKIGDGFEFDLTHHASTKLELFQMLIFQRRILRSHELPLLTSKRNFSLLNFFTIATLVVCLFTKFQYQKFL